MYKVREETTKVKIQVAEDNNSVKGNIRRLFEILQPCFDGAGPQNSRLCESFIEYCNIVIFLSFCFLWL